MWSLKLLIVGSLVTLGFFQFQKNSVAESKINGISLVASGSPLLESAMPPIISISANQAALMPFGFMKSLTDTSIWYDTERQWFGETKEGIMQYTNLLRKNNISVMIKPQIWVSHGEFTGDITMNSEQEWRAFEKQYASFILAYAQIASELDVSMFCIGTELKSVVRERPLFWKLLITQIRNVYKGKITYAANWDSYGTVSFWKELDYIGIDAYFPVSNSKTPTKEECRQGWQVHKQKLRELSAKEGKQILFTEYGYCSTDYAAKEPWNPPGGGVNLEAQQNALSALFDEFWQEKWFAGGFVWKWFHDHKNAGGIKHNQFTPQNKPAQEVLKNYYSP